jgi:hypothetical protein
MHLFRLVSQTNRCAAARGVLAGPLPREFGEDVTPHLHNCSRADPGLFARLIPPDGRTRFAVPAAGLIKRGGGHRDDAIAERDQDERPQQLGD